MELTTNLSNADIAFGEAQMDQMIKDRPEFARYVSKHDDVWQFCVRAFAGAAIGEHIIWNNSLPENERYLADHLGPYDGHPGYIQIRKNVASGDRPGRPLTCEELWSCAVFELENIRSHRAFLALYYRALDGKLSREEWIRGCSRLEYEALKRTRNDWVKLWLPLVAARHIRASGYHWGANVPETYEAWISRYWDPNSYPWDVFGDYFDKEMAPFVKYSVARRVGR